jgi:glycosyltransferase involved in cell wall biosynthesis
MKILVAHNFYQQAGGEDQCFAAEVAMLKANGHQVTQYCVSNDSIDGMSRLGVAARTIWSRSSASELRRLLRTHRPHIAHFHNTFPLISPAAYYAARAEGAAVVQTLHNFRLLCVNALLFRAGEVCERCLGKAIPWPGVVHRCYRASRGASAAVAALNATHRLLGTWRNAVDVYIALSESSRGKLVAGGLPADKIIVKPNFVFPDPGPGAGDGGYAVFVGRLSAEKGIDTLLEAWRQSEATPPLRIVGDGQLAAAVQQAASRNTHIQWQRGLSHEAVCELIGKASVLVLPSGCYENFPRVVIEAFAKGTPVIVSRRGAMAEIVDDGCNGIHFEPGNAAALAAAARRILADPTVLRRMRQAARDTFVRKFTADANHAELMAIYRHAIEARVGHELEYRTAGT